MIISYIFLFSLALIGLFFYHRRSTFFQLVPLSLMLGAIFLITGTQSQAVGEFASNWKIIPGLLINVVFATLFFGKKIMGFKKIWKFAGPQIAFGQTLAWGQYVVGIALTALVLVPLFSISPLTGALIEISFEGGHGTVAGLKTLFNELNFAEGYDLALGLATIGILVGIASGLFMTAIYRSRSGSGKKPIKKNSKKRPLYSMFGEYIVDTHNSYFAHHKIPRTLLQIALVGLAILIGAGIKWILSQIESFMQLFVNIPDIIQFMPLFPLAMIGGIAIQLILQKIGYEKIIHGKTMVFIGALALEIVIITAIATMSLSAISENLIPFILIALAGTLWNISAFLLFAPSIIKKNWFERGIGDYGQSMGMTATGLLLMRSADPANKSQALERFGYKQLLFEPVVGGGLFTAMSMILIAKYEQLPIFILTFIFLCFWLIVAKKALLQNKKHLFEVVFLCFF